MRQKVIFLLLPSYFIVEMGVYIIDFQAFKLLNNDFILKEVAIVDVCSNIEKHFLIKPPTSSNNLHPELQSRINYITNHIHGISWNSGCYELRDVEKVLRSTIQEATKIYIKGSERVRFLKDLCDKDQHNKIIDLSEFPNISKSIARNPYFRCMYNYPLHNKLRCSLEQAVRYRDTLVEQYYFS